MQTMEKRETTRQTHDMIARSLAVLKPPPDMTLSEWADEYRMLSPEASAAPGRWHTETAPYQKEIMDAIGDPHIRKVVVMTAAQIGKTDAFILNTLGYYMDYAPAPVLIMEPTLEMGQSFSKERLMPMLRDTPKLKDKVDMRSRAAGNTIMTKSFPGGQVSIVGANSPASLAMRPVKVLLADEVDRYPPSAGTEGDPLSLAEKRQTTFWDKKTIMVSTPVIKGISRIETEYLMSTQEEWNVPCPQCGHYQPLMWADIVFDKNDLSKGIRCVCERCGVLSTESEWKAQGIHGKYIAANPKAETRGFHLNSLSSAFCSWESVVAKFLAAKRRSDLGDNSLMQVWVNTELGETWEEEGEQITDSELASRCEFYDAEVPDGVKVLTAGIDTQDNRFEIEVVGWGEGKESWGIRYQKIFGDLKSPDVWNELDIYLDTEFYRKDGTSLKISCVCMDTGGHFYNEVCSFCKERTHRRVFAIRGVAGFDRPFTENPTTRNRTKTPVFNIGVDTGKSLVYQRLKLTTKGPNYCHFPSNDGAGYNSEKYFEGLTAEKMVMRYVKGRSVVRWEIKDAAHKRNEPLDCRNYATAALEILNPVLTKQEARPAGKRGWRTISKGI